AGTVTSTSGMKRPTRSTLTAICTTVATASRMTSPSGPGPCRGRSIVAFCLADSNRWQRHPHAVQVPEPRAFGFDVVENGTLGAGDDVVPVRVVVAVGELSGDANRFLGVGIPAGSGIGTDVGFEHSSAGGLHGSCQVDHLERASTVAGR